MDDIKIFAKNVKELEIMIQMIRTYCQEWDLTLKKWAMLIMKKRKRKATEGIELPNQENIRTLGEKENYIGSGHQKTEMKDE